MVTLCLFLIVCLFMFQIKAPLKLLYTKPNTASHDSVIRNTSDIIDN